MIEPSDGMPASDIIAVDTQVQPPLPDLCLTCARTDASLSSNGSVLTRPYLIKPLDTQGLTEKPSAELPPRSPVETDALRDRPDLSDTSPNTNKYVEGGRSIRKPEPSISTQLGGHDGTF